MLNIVTLNSIMENHANMETRDVTYITKRGLKERGWTDSLIRRFLPEPDSTECNPYYRCAAPMRLYSTERVAAIEKTPEFVAAHEVAERRSLAAMCAADTKRRATTTFAESATVSVPQLDRHELIRLACKSYNNHNWERDRVATPDSDQGFLDRICVNHLRHRLTKYDSHLNNTRGKVGSTDANLTLKRRVLAEIARVYPFFAEECDRQAKTAQEQHLWKSQRY